MRRTIRANAKCAICRVWEFRTTVVVEIYRVCCPDCGIKIEKVPQLPSKALFSKRFEDAVGQACESAAARQVALRFGLAASTVRNIDLRYLERWAASRRKPALVRMGVDEIYPGKKHKFVTVVSTGDRGSVGAAATALELLRNPGMVKAVIYVNVDTAEDHRGIVPDKANADTGNFCAVFHRPKIRRPSCPDFPCKLL